VRASAALTVTCAGAPVACAPVAPGVIAFATAPGARYALRTAPCERQG
jgi:hypothetical protein